LAGSDAEKDCIVNYGPHIPGSCFVISDLWGGFLIYGVAQISFLAKGVMGG
jgi:hypothetical protein